MGIPLRRSANQMWKPSGAGVLLGVGGKGLAKKERGAGGEEAEPITNVLDSPITPIGLT